MSEEIAIRVEDVSKDFKLPYEQHNSLKSKVVHALKRTKGYKTQHALKNVSFEVKKGEFFGIVGRNGSGKSTMLKMLAGIYQPTKGKISVKGKLVPFIELGVGFNPELTGRENVFLNGALLGFTNDQVAKMYDSIVEFAELEKFMEQKLKNYSSGMQVRLAFSMAVRAKADILLIDEVLAVGDADFQRKCYNYFKLLKDNGTTVVFVSHDMGAIRDFCDRAVLIEDGVAQVSGETQKITTAYQELFSNGSRPHNKRFGSGEVVFESVKVRKTKDYIYIDSTLKANKAYNDLMTGFRINNAIGQPLHETNTNNEKIDLEKIKPGQKKLITWKFPNVYSDGIYTVDLYNYGDGKVFDNLTDAARFNISHQNPSASLIRPQVSFSIKKND